MSKQLAELHDGTLFKFHYDLNSVYAVMRQVCEGGQDTGPLDHIEVRRIATKVGPEDSAEWTFNAGDAERANPYAEALPVWAKFSDIPVPDAPLTPEGAEQIKAACISYAGQ